MTEPVKIKWHQIFAAMLREQLQQVMITVIDELPVTGEIDVVLLQRLINSRAWTPQQRQALPDGIRDSLARHFLLEVKITESFSRDVVEQALGYDIFYRRKADIANLPASAVASFIICAKTPRRQTLVQFGYESTQWAGIYQSNKLFLERINLMVLNELSPQPHNVFFKLFASRMEAKRQAARGVKKWWLESLPSTLFWLIQGLLHRWLQQGEENIMEVLTAEKLIEEGKLLKELMLPLLTEEDIKQTPFAKQLWQKGRQEGQQEGWQKGQLEGERVGWQKGQQKALVKTLSRILVIQFQVELSHFAAKLPQLSIEALEALCEVALTVPTITEFEQALAGYLPPPDSPSQS